MILFLQLLPAIVLHLQCPRQPQKRVDAAEHKCSDQERCHAPEGPEEKWVLLRIVVRCMRQITGELTSRSRMALLTRGDDILSAEM
jgi:hypothetical protein